MKKYSYCILNTIHRIIPLCDIPEKPKLFRQRIAQCLGMVKMFKGILWGTEPHIILTMTVVEKLYVFLITHTSVHKIGFCFMLIRL